EAVQALETMPTEAHLEPQRNRALRRARALDEAIRKLRENASPSGATPSQDTPARPISDWKVVGPFAMDVPSPLDPAQRPDPRAPHAGLDGAMTSWRPVRAEPNGMVDLGRLYSTRPRLNAFALAEIKLPGPGKGRLLIGSDDTIQVWLNGRKVHDFPGARSF